jgi:hypothetical protein
VRDRRPEADVLPSSCPDRTRGSFYSRICVRALILSSRLRHAVPTDLPVLFPLGCRIRSHLVLPEIERLIANCQDDYLSALIDIILPGIISASLDDSMMDRARMVLERRGYVATYPARFFRVFGSERSLIPMHFWICLCVDPVSRTSSPATTHPNRPKNPSAGSRSSRASSVAGRSSDLLPSSLSATCLSLRYLLIDTFLVDPFSSFTVSSRIIIWAHVFLLSLFHFYPLFHAFDAPIYVPLDIDLSIPYLFGCLASLFDSP